jgi:predicted glycosyltransferase
MSRILIYSHNVVGIGHVRMAGKIAVALAEADRHKCLVVSGSSHVPCPPKDSGWEIIKLPSLFKTGGQFRSATLMSSSETFDVRRKMLLSIASNFNPDLLVVYHSPIGLRGELLDALNYCKDHKINAILILRDILNSPDLTTSLWKRKDYYSFIDHFYDVVIHQGERSIFDAETLYKYPAQIVDKTLYSGYSLPLSGPNLPAKKIHGTTVSIGGGRVGYDLFSEVLRVNTSFESLPSPTTLLIGPLTPATVRKQLLLGLKGRSNFRIHEPVSDPLPLFEGSKIIIHNGGYNTTCEAILSGRPSYIFPRYTTKDRECQIRAMILDRSGIVRHINAISAVLPFTPAFEKLTWGGLSRLSAIISAVCEGQSVSKIKRDLSL